MKKSRIQSKIACNHCGSLETRKVNSRFGKSRYYCRGCRCWFHVIADSPDGIKRRMIPSKPLPSPAHLVLELRAIAQRMGQTPTGKEIQKLGRFGKAQPLHDYRIVFGSYKEAIDRAGLAPGFDRNLEKEKLLEELRALRTKLKRPLRVLDIIYPKDRKILSPRGRFEQAFGTLAKAIQAAGAGKQKYTRADIIESIRKLDAKLDRPVMLSDIDEQFRAGSGPSVGAIVREFGGLVGVRRAAGTKDIFYFKLGRPIKTWSKYKPEQMISQLQSLAGQLGRNASTNDIKRYSKLGLCASQSTFIKIFGSLSEAYRRAGFQKVKKRGYTSQELLAVIEKAVKEKGRMLTSREWIASSKAGKTPSLGVIYRQFGTLLKLKSLLGSIDKKS